MEIEILGAESLGVRSLATCVRTASHTFLIDPGVSVVPRRHAHPPHPLELAACWNTRRLITERSGEADAIVLTHYHYDHFTPFHASPTDWCDDETAEALYRDRVIFAKHGQEHINGSQRRRAETLDAREFLDVRIAEGAHWHAYEGTTAVPHGPRGSRQGFVTMAVVRERDETFVHASDIQLLDPHTVTNLIRLQPTIVLVSGPPLYHPRVTDDERRIGLHQLKRLVEAIPTCIVDHHFLRSADHVREGEVARRVAERAGHAFVTAAEFMRRPTLTLEAHRPRLHEAFPVDRRWFDGFLAGDEPALDACRDLAGRLSAGEFDERLARLCQG
ncbi:MAG: MBL fold metallo-hydrolase [Planctomycetes bacterium]|nr:MBL fold metallo-hydrolase [Planctomycetota bacterium]